MRQHVQMAMEYRKCLEIYPWSDVPNGYRIPNNGRGTLTDPIQIQWWFRRSEQDALNVHRRKEWEDRMRWCHD